MSGQTESFTVTVVPTNTSVDPKVYPTSESDHSSSNKIASELNNVSFVNITYTIQPEPIKSLFKKIPPKKILDDVR